MVAFVRFFPALIAFEKECLGHSELEDLFPKVYAAKVDTDKGSYNIMEDLTSSGHYTLTFQKEDKFEHMSLMVEKTGLLHAVGYAYGQKHGNQPQ